MPEVRFEDTFSKQLVLLAIWLGVIRPRRDDDHTCPSSADVKKACNFVCTPINVVMGGYVRRGVDWPTFLPFN
jgi:hypothetical protein